MGIWIFLVLKFCNNNNNFVNNKNIYYLPKIELFLIKMYLEHRQIIFNVFKCHITCKYQNTCNQIR